jgi:hypothetical protein
MKPITTSVTAEAARPSREGTPHGPTVRGFGTASLVRSRTRRTHPTANSGQGPRTTGDLKPITGGFCAHCSQPVTVLGGRYTCTNPTCNYNSPG